MKTTNHIRAEIIFENITAQFQQVMALLGADGVEPQPLVHPAPSAPSSSPATARNAAPARVKHTNNGTNGNATGGARTPTSTGHGRGKKRDPAVIQKLEQDANTYIHQNPGQSIESIAKAIGVTTRDLSLPVQKLLKDRLIGSKGQRRATRYYPHGSSVVASA